MIPILYNEAETNFNTNGIGLLHDTIAYLVREERNGLFELELTYPAGGQWASELLDFRLISAKPNDEDESHLFRIYEIERNLEEDSINVYASSKTNDLSGNQVNSVVVTDVTAQQALTAIKSGLVEPTTYDFISDIQTLSSSEWDFKNPLLCIAGSENSVISKWGGEIKRTDNVLYVYARRGTDKVTTIRQGRGLDGFKMTTSIKGLITAIVPYVTYVPNDSEEAVRIVGTMVNSDLVSNYPVKYIYPIDFSSYGEIFPGEENLTFEQYNAQIVDNLNNIAPMYFTYLNPGCDKPKVTIEVDLSQLSDSSEYEKFKNLEHISLTDTVVVWVERFNVDVEVTITSLVYNGMSEMVESFVAGNVKTGMLEDAQKRYSENIDKIKEYVDTVENGIYNSIRYTSDQKNNIFSGFTEPDEELVKENDLWYKPVADGEIEMYRWTNGVWTLAVTNADKIVIGSIDANLVNLVNLNASNISLGTLTGASGGWDLDTGDFWLGSSREDANLRWDGSSLKIIMASGGTVEEAITESNTAISLRALKTEVEGPIFKQGTAPAHVNGRLWLNTSVTPNQLKRSTGSAWVNVTPTSGAEIGLSDAQITSKVESTSIVLAKKADVTLVDNAWKARFDEQVVGGANKLLNSNFEQELLHWTVDGQAAYGIFDGYKAVRVNGNYFGIYQEPTDVITGKIYTISFRARSSYGAAPITIGFLNQPAGAYTTVALTESFQDYSFTTIPLTSANKLIHVYGGPSHPGDIIVTNIKIEEGNVRTAWSPHGSELYSGVTKIDKDGVTVSQSNSEINSSLRNTGIEVYDGSSMVAAFGNAGASIPQLATEKITANNIAYGVDSWGVVEVGNGKAYGNVTSAFNAYTEGKARLLRGKTVITFLVFGTIYDDLDFTGLIGDTIIVIMVEAGRNGKIIGNHKFTNNMVPIFIQGTGVLEARDGIYHIHNINSSCLLLYGGLKINSKNAPIAVLSDNGGTTIVESCDFINSQYAMWAQYGAFLMSVNNRGGGNNGPINNAYHAATGGRIQITGTVPLPVTNLIGTSFGVVENLGTSQVPSAYAPPSITTQVYTSTFSSATFDTLQYGTSNVDSYYGASACQNRWDSSMVWKQGRIRMGAEIYNFYNGGSAITVNVRLRRKNSSHGNSGAVLPAGIGTFASGALRGGWTSWATVSSSLFGSGGADLRLYNGVQGINGYAIWDAIEVQVTVTKNV